MVTLLHLADARLSGRLYVTEEAAAEAAEEADEEAAADEAALLKRARAAGRTALRRAVDCALQENVDAVLVAGGLFDDRLLDYDTEQLLTDQLARLADAGVRCFYAAGPPDPGGARFRGAEVRWPASVHRFTGPSPEAVTLDSEKNGRPMARIVGAGHAGPEADAPRAAAFPDPPDEDRPHIGLFPAPLAGASEDLARPRHALQQALRNAGYAYWALGGAPRGALVEENETQSAAWYAGPLAGRGPAQPGPQGGLLVTLAPGEAPQVAFRSFAPLRWADLTLDDLAAADTQHALIQQAQRALRAAAAPGEDRAARMARFTLTGGCPLAPELHANDERRRLEDALEDHLDLAAAFVRLRHLTLPADPDRHRGEPHVLSEALDLLDRAAADPAHLRELAPDAPAATDVTDEDDLRRLVEALDREACARLLVE